MNRLSKSLFPFLFLTISLFAASFGATASQHNGAPSWQINTFNDSDEILIHTKLADYLFTAEGGVLRSIYLHFAPLGAGALEMIPDTETVFNPDSGILERSFVRDPVFPFALTLDGTSSNEVIYDYTVEETLDQQLLIRFTTEQNGILITKEFTVGENPYYSIDFVLELENTSGSSVSVDNGFQLSMGQGVGRESISAENLVFLYGDEVRNQPFNSPGFRGLGFHKGDLMLFLRPMEGSDVLSPLENRISQQETTLALEVPQFSLGDGESRGYLFRMYGGRDKYTLLQTEGIGALNPPGFFVQFIIPVVEFLRWLYNITGNYGWAIIIFTILMRLILFPLARKQFHSMSKMGELKPKLEKIQQRYPTMRRLKELHPNMSQEELFKRDKENRAQLQQKMMGLYKEEGVNPLGGCLPMLAQLPVIIILWQAVLYSAELIHFTPGFLWMQDLALRDPTYIIVGLTVIAMLLQTKTTPTMTTPGQSGPNPMVMMTVSVAIMVFFLRDFPAGLWLYYFLTTFIQVIQQVFIMKEMKKKEAESVAAAGGAAAISAATAEENGSEPTDPASDGSTNGKKDE
jgi:YidC/Oxa1 family membrane protein insertase